MAIRRLVFVAGVLGCALGTTPAFAQLNTQHIKGAVGLKAASQPPPHWYFNVPLIYVYNTDTIRNADGDKLPIDASITAGAFGVGGVDVTTKKLFGGNYSFSFFFPAWSNNRLQGTEIDQNPGPGLTDSAVSPITLGWHFKRADAMAGYTLFVPTGRYADGATNNTGFGMWAHEFAVGTTVYLNESHQFHAATMASFDFQTKKEDSDTKVGNTMNLEGGVGGDFLRGGLTTGLVYYASFKLTEDQFDNFPNVLVRGKNKVFALGPEATLAIASKGTLYGFVKVNYFWEVYAQTTTQGDALMLSLVLPMRPIKLPGTK
jgi:hypothetical protein